MNEFPAMPPPEITTKALMTVVIPTCSRLEDLARCLDSIVPGRQADMRLMSASGSAEPGPKDLFYEVIVTDDGRGVTAEAMVRERFAWAQWTQGPGRGPAANRNHGARQAAGEWVVFIDDDCVAGPGWLAEIARHAINPALEVIEGRTVIPDKRDNPFLHGVENDAGGLYWSCNLAVRRQSFLGIGGFDEDFAIAGGEDLEFACRFQRRGLRTTFVSPALVLHPQSPRTPLRVLRRLFFDMKWYRLFLLKIGESPPLSSSFPRVITDVVREHLNRVLRQSLGTILGFARPGWKTSFFNVLFLWLLMPLQLPYQILWEFRFRNHLRGP